MTTDHTPLAVDDISVPGDRYEFEIYPIPVIALAQRQAQQGHNAKRTITAESFGATLYRYAEDEETWIFLGRDTQQLEISLESARRLQRALGVLLSFHDAISDENT